MGGFQRFRWGVAQFFEVWWWRNYLKPKNPEEYRLWKTDYWRHYLRDCEIRISPGQRVLDAGCGPAGIFLFSRNNTVALDPLLNQYRQLPHFRPDLLPGVTFVEGTLEHMTYQRMFDLIFCINTLNHVRDLSAALEAIRRAACPGATVVISIDTHNYPILARMLRIFSWPDILHPHQYTLEGYLGHFRAHGFMQRAVILKKARYMFHYHAVVLQAPSE
jgi:2-polyprenyl-6-hydroxyphenyl methylase/3-demethylubiquinone-9 3-methyltransferase